QSGKTYLLYQDLVCNAFNERADYLVISPNYPSLRIIQNYIESCLEGFMLDFETVASFPNYTIRRLPNGSTITFLSGSNLSSTLIGRRFKSVYIDEASRIVGIHDTIMNNIMPTVCAEGGYISIFGTMDYEEAKSFMDMGFNITRCQFDIGVFIHGTK
ncbi:MAG: terminase large subunit domain-containing protein, partial [Romboutsia timonensis]